MILTRIVWQFTVPYLVRAIDRRPQQRGRRMGAGARFVGAWAGMRGAVSLAAALAIPFATDAGAPFPQRNLIIFLTFAVIFGTLVLQGLTLPAVIRAVHLAPDDEAEGEELRARIIAARAALEEIDVLEEEEWTRDDTLERMRGALPVPQAPLRRPCGQDRGRRLRGPLARLPAHVAGGDRGPARGARASCTPTAASPPRR